MSSGKIKLVQEEFYSSESYKSPLLKRNQTWVKKKQNLFFIKRSINRNFFNKTEVGFKKCRNKVMTFYSS